MSVPGVQNSGRTALSVQAVPATGAMFESLLLGLILIFPLTIFDDFGGKLPLCALISLGGVACMFLGRIPGTTELCWSIGISILSVIQVATFIAPGITLRPFLSLGFFFLPYFAWFAGYCALRELTDLGRMLRIMAIWFSIFAVCYLQSIGSGPVISESYFTGTVLGLPTYGDQGYNSLMVMFATLICIMLHCLTHAETPLWQKWLLVPGLLALTYLVIFSMSRQAWLGIIFFVIIWSKNLAPKVKLALVAMALCGLYVFYDELRTLFEQFVQTWGFKFEKNIQDLSEGNYDGFTAGRLDLYTIQIEDLFSNPLFGNGFHGFQLYGDTRFRDEESVGLGPHHQILGGAWKMGIVAAVFYYRFLWLGIRAAWSVRFQNSHTRCLWLLTLTYWIVFNNIQDAYSFIPTGILMSFLAGGACRIGSKEPSRLAAARTQVPAAIRSPGGLSGRPQSGR